MNIKKIRKDFPILRQKVNGKLLVYLDNAATTQKPKQVIQAEKEYYEKYNSNVHRAMHALGEKATQEFEKAHKKTAEFIGAKGIQEIVFTKGTTESINLLAYSLGEQIAKHDEIVLTEMEHHSNIVPWLLLAKRTGAKIKYVPVSKKGELELHSIERIITKKTKIVSFAHASNVLGTINPIKEIVLEAQAKGATTIVDAAQSVPHMKVNVKKLGCDFLAFSGHKMLGPTGIGVLYGKEEKLEEMQPFQSGGQMISEVFWDRAEWNELPWKFEAGTPNIAGAIGLEKAIEYLQKTGMKNIERHGKKTIKYTLNELHKMQNVKFFGPEAKKRVSLVSFNLGKIHAHDVATVLDGEGIAIRSGHHCAQPLMRKMGMTGSARASYYLYNTKEETDKLIEGLKKTEKIFAR